MARLERLTAASRVPVTDTASASGCRVGALSVPPPAPPVIRVLIKLVEYGSAYGLTWFYYPQDEEVGVAQWSAPYELREMEMRWTRNVPGKPPDDVALCTFHLLNITGGSPDATWITADYTAAEAAFDAFWNSLRPYYTTNYVLSEFVWRADGPAFRPFGTELSPVLRRVSRSAAGSSAAAGQHLPPQVALSVTERTAAKFTVENVEGVGAQLRNRWGRFYLPSMVLGASVNGRPDPTVMDIVADAADTLYGALITADLHPVMYSPTTGSSWSVDEISVDDVWDVVRSRRFRDVTAREVRTTV